MKPESMPPDAIREQLERILSSAGFSQNERLSRFLRFVVERSLEGRGAEIKESVLATEIFGRKPDYDPKIDSIVRTEAARLRARLDHYYQREGSQEPVVIDLPKGGYVPTFRMAAVRAAAPEPGRPTRSWVPAGLIALATMILAGVWIQQQKEPITIAVLPFANLANDPAQDFFSDGLTDEVIHHLAIIEGLSVRSRTSSFVLKGQPANLQEAGRRLNADYILEGSVLREAQRLRITARLVRVKDDVPLWSSKFDRDVSDIFAIQDEISNGIANQLRLKLHQGRRRYETSVAAYDAYLLAQSRNAVQGYYSDERIAALNRAIEKDASFAPAYAALGALYAIRSIQAPLDHGPEELRRMQSMTEKALQLDPFLPEAYDALGLVHARYAQWDQAEKSFRRAIELGPGDSIAYLHYALWLLRVNGRIDEGLQVLHQVQGMDPLSPDVHTALGEMLLAAHRYQEAFQHCSTLPPGDEIRPRCLARARLGQGQIAAAIELLQNEPTLPNQPLSRGILGYALAMSGDRGKAEQLAAASNLPTEQALIFAGLRDKDRTLTALERLSALGPQRVGVFLNYPELAFLQSDVRLAGLRKNVGLSN